jgi:hypothetical protein
MRNDIEAARRLAIPQATGDFFLALCTIANRQFSRQIENSACLNSLFSQGVHHGRSHPIPAAREPEASSAFAPISAIPRSTVCCVRGALGKKHRGMECVLADGMR